jgi:YfiH family protein
MNPTKTLLLNEALASLKAAGKVAAFFSDRSADFVLKEGQSDLTQPQKECLSQQLGVSKVVNIRQVHGDHVLVVSSEDLQNQGPLTEADGVITNSPNVPIAVRTADCLSVFLFDPKKNCIGLVHAGWRGTEKQIALKAAKLMRENWGCAPEDLRAAFGPAIRSCCYEVGPEFKNFFPKETFERDGKIFLDLAGVNRNQLLRYGVKPKHIFDSQACTCCDPAYFSYRREGKAAGRHLSVLVLR